MDWVAFWTAAAALAAWVAAIGALGVLLAITLQLQLDREGREVDYYRKLTPFLSYETTEVNASEVSTGQAGTAQAINRLSFQAGRVYADGGGYAFNVLASIVQTNATSGGGTLLGQRVIRYLREDRAERPPLHTTAFSPKAGQGFQGNLRVTFVDMFTVHHEAQQAAIRWACGDECHVHVVRPSPSSGVLPRLARRLRLY